MPTPDYSVDLDLGEPPPELQEYARKHCGEDPETKLQAIYELREMIYDPLMTYKGVVRGTSIFRNMPAFCRKRGECTPHRMDDEFLIRFLRARNFVPQRAHRLIVNYYQFKEDHPELFENIFPLDLQSIGEANVIAVPPYRDQDGRRLMIFRIGCWDPKSIPVEHLFRATILAIELGMMEQRTQILGGVAIFDLEDIGTQHAWQITPSVASKIVKMLVSCYPTSTHAIHIINHSWLFDKMYNIFKPMLTKEMRSRIYFHGYDLTSLHKHIHKEHLPERYGGGWPDYSYTIWLESLRKNVVIAKEMLNCGYKFREEEFTPEVVRQLKEDGIEIS